MELLAYIQEEFIRDDQAIAPESQASNLTANVNIETSFQDWLKKLTTKSSKLSLNIILASTTILIGLGSTMTALAEVMPSSDVKYVQTLLAKNGFDPGAIDGVAGASTKNAILRAQKSLGLTPDGIVGSRTITALEGGSIRDASPVSAPSALVPSSSVMNLQKLLVDRGFYNGAVDGIMGNQTRAAIVAAQKAYNLTPDGVAGSQTLAALEADANTAAVTPISATTTTTTKSAEVANLQELLSRRGFYNGAIDGIMGNQTRAAIVAAQKNYGLTADGIAGSQTLAALNSGNRQVNVALQNREAVTKDVSEAKASDSNVATVQQLLARRGFYNGAIDGVKGTQTKAAIIAAQNAYGLTPDGIAGVQTVAALERNARTSTSINSRTQAATQTPTQSPRTNSSSTDESVANLQNLLTDRGFYSGPVTGFLGPKTKAAIIAAQKAYGLTPDGVAGSQTIAALESGSPRQQITVRTVTPAPTVRVAPIPQAAPQPIPQPELQPKVQVQPAPAQPQAKVVQPQVTPQVQVQPKPQETVKPQAQPKPATPAPATPAPQVSANNAQVLTLQNLLSKRGFYNGKADGVLNAETRNAIVRAQNFYTITPADGAPSNKLIDSLSKDTFISEGN